MLHQRSYFIHKIQRIGPAHKSFARWSCSSCLIATPAHLQTSRSLFWFAYLKGFNEKVLMVLANSNNETPSIIQIPQQIPKMELLQVMLLEWISNYENFKRNSTLAIATKAAFKRYVDGTIKTIFEKLDDENLPFSQWRSLWSSRKETTNSCYWTKWTGYLFR